MTISMYQVSVPVFLRNLGALSGVLDKAAAFAEARKLDQAVLLATRLYPDMFPLNVQVGQVCTHATRGVAQLAGLTQPDFGATDTTIAGPQGARRQGASNSSRPPSRNRSTAPRTRTSCSNSARAK